MQDWADNSIIARCLVVCVSEDVMTVWCSSSVLVFYQMPKQQIKLNNFRQDLANPFEFLFYKRVPGPLLLQKMFLLEVLQT